MLDPIQADEELPFHPYLHVFWSVGGSGELGEEEVQSKWNLQPLIVTVCANMNILLILFLLLWEKRIVQKNCFLFTMFYFVYSQ